MKTIAILSLWLCTAASLQTRPPLFLSYQDSIGQYSFGYSDPMSARSEYRASDGITRGTYSYIDRNGLIQTAEYEAGKDLGFRVKATNLPQAPLPVQETIEVMAAREKHLKLLDEARRQEENDLALKMGERLTKTMEGRSAGSTIMSEAGNVDSLGMPEMKKIDVQTMTEARNAGSPTVTKVADNQVKHEVVSNIRSVIGLQDGKETIIKATVPLEVSPEASIKQPDEKLQIQSRINAQPIVPITFPSEPRNPSLAVTGPIMLPQPVGYTPEVLAAREAHFRAYETAAKLAAETDMNPRLLEQLLRGQSVLGSGMLLNGNQVDDKSILDKKITGESKIVYPATITTMLNVKASDQRMDGERKELPMMTMMDDNRKMDNGKVNLMEKAQPIEMLKPKATSGITPASTSLRLMDIRLPLLNEFQQTKLKAGAYNTPIEISHLSPTNVLPKSYHPIFGNSFYVYL